MVTHRMTYVQAALEVLRSSPRPLSTEEITKQALEQGFIDPERGKTPHKSMAAALYKVFNSEGSIVKIGTPGKERARRGSVRWTVREK
jgi:HB1/ASXL restriction endonuclease-like protein with HTH domain